MHSSTVTSAAVLLALAPSALAVGCAKVVNNCPSNMYYASVAQSKHADMAELPSTGYEEAFSLPGVGVSIKLAPELVGKVTQFEYTWADGNIYYDISNIDGYLFSEGGMALVPSEANAAGYPTCVPVICPAGEATCTAAYNQPDDVRTMVCPDSTNLTMTLCPNSTSTSGGSPSTTSTAGYGQVSNWWQHTKRDTHSHGRVHARHMPN